MERLTNKREADAQREEYKRRLANKYPKYPRNIQEEQFLRLAAYEDTGLEPEEIKELLHDTTGPLHHKLGEWIDADASSRLVVLPCKVGDKLYAVGEKRIIRCDICETYLDDKKGPEYLVSFDCDSDCDGCPFNNWSQDYSGEWSCDGEYGQSVVFGSDIGKTVFLTREEAAMELKGGEG